MRSFNDMGLSSALLEAAAFVGDGGFLAPKSEGFFLFHDLTAPRSDFFNTRAKLVPGNSENV
jgi:hypothetical protein